MLRWRRGITRLCHITPSRNLAHIIQGHLGILASKHLMSDDRTVFNPSDMERIDGYGDHVCCSIQYPNAWFFRQARERERLFRDWVVVLIHPRYLWRSGTKFCVRNAAARGGSLVDVGWRAFEAMFADVVEGSVARKRNDHHPSSLPTDEQAEVLVPDRVELADVLGIAVYDGAQAGSENARLEILGVAVPPILIVPEFYDPGRLSTLLRGGRYPLERDYQTGG